LTNKAITRIGFGVIQV